MTTEPLQIPEKDLNSALMNVYINDLKKKDINKKLRADLLARHLKQNDLSIREFAKLEGFNKSTIEDWLLLSKISEEEYKRLKNSGLKECNIYKLLRNNKRLDIKQFSELDLQIDKTINMLNVSTITKHKTEITILKLKELEKTIKTALFRLGE